MVVETARPRKAGTHREALLGVVRRHALLLQCGCLIPSSSRTRAPDRGRKGSRGAGVTAPTMGREERADGGRKEIACGAGGVCRHRYPWTHPIALFGSRRKYGCRMRSLGPFSRSTSPPERPGRTLKDWGRISRSQMYLRKCLLLYPPPPSEPSPLCNLEENRVAVSKNVLCKAFGITELERRTKSPSFDREVQWPISAQYYPFGKPKEMGAPSRGPGFDDSASPAAALRLTVPQNVFLSILWKSDSCTAPSSVVSANPIRPLLFGSCLKCSRSWQVHFGIRSSTAPPLPSDAPERLYAL